MVPANGFRWGATSRKAARSVVGRLVQTSKNCGPTSGQFLTLSGEKEPPGYQLPDLRRDPSPLHRTQAKPGRGPMTMPRLMTVIIAACEPRATAEEAWQGD
jgi:hypothetical protein